MEFKRIQEMVRVQNVKPVKTESPHQDQETAKWKWRCGLLVKPTSATIYHLIVKFFTLSFSRWMPCKEAVNANFNVLVWPGTQKKRQTFYSLGQLARL